jgi:hypothetical protein
MPTPAFPQALLRHKLVMQPPQGVRANVLHSLHTLDAAGLSELCEASRRPEDTRALLPTAAPSTAALLSDMAANSALCACVPCIHRGSPDQTHHC